jgi:hypothetical protein
VPAEVDRGHEASDAGSSLTGSPTRGDNGAVAERDKFGGLFVWLVTGTHHNWSMVTGLFRRVEPPAEARASDEAGPVAETRASDEAGPVAEEAPASDDAGPLARSLACKLLSWFTLLHESRDDGRRRPVGQDASKHLKVCVEIRQNRSKRT